MSFQISILSYNFWINIVDALDKAEEKLKEMMLAFDYENQV